MRNKKPALPVLLDGSCLYPSLSFRCMAVTVFFICFFWISPACFGAESCSTADCHAELGNVEFVHNPVAGSECDVCHVETGKPHPGEPGAFEMADEGVELCLQCHDAPGMDKKHIHHPVSEDCIKCHSPHQGSRNKLLRESVGKLCLQCHEKIANMISDAKSSHEPVAEGKCLTCHMPHGSDFAPLLISYYPRNAYTQFSAKNFALCFRCHDKEAFTLKRTNEVTNFRNGNENLHYIHVNRTKGRVCVNCHSIHGADLPKLIHSTSPAFGVWNIPIVIEMTKTGATCIVGCHKEKSYDREKKVVNP